MPGWVFFNTSLYYLMTPLFIFGEESNCHRMPASLHLCGLKMGPSENLATVGCLNNVSASGERTNRVTCGQLTTHPFLVLPHILVALLHGYVWCPWSSGSPALTVAGLRCMQHCVFPFSQGASRAPAPHTATYKSRKLSPGGIPPLFGSGRKPMSR